MSGARIMVVEDEGVVALQIKEALEGMGYLVPGIALTGEEAVAKVLGIGLTLATWALRPNRAEVDPWIVLETHDLVKNDLHNSNTDFVKLGGCYWLDFVSSPFHFGSTESRLHLRVAVIGGRLFLYALENRDFKAEPYRTVFTSSADGTAWDEFRPLPGLDGWPPLANPRGEGRGVRDGVLVGTRQGRPPSVARRRLWRLARIHPHLRIASPLRELEAACREPGHSPRRPCPLHVGRPDLRRRPLPGRYRLARAPGVLPRPQAHIPFRDSRRRPREDY